MEEQELFEVVCWPQVRTYRKLPGFERNAVSITSLEGIERYGEGAYFINHDWLKKADLALSVGSHLQSD